MCSLNPQFTRQDVKGLRQCRSCLNIHVVHRWVSENCLLLLLLLLFFLLLLLLLLPGKLQLPGSCYLLGTPETSRRGRSTRKARRAFTSNPPGLPPCPCSDWWLVSPSSSAFSSLVKNSKTTLKSLSENNKNRVLYLNQWLDLKKKPKKTIKLIMPF